MEQEVDNKYKVRKGICPLWATRSVSIAINWAIIGYLTYFCTNHLGLNVGIVGTMMLLAKIIDAITNFIAAYIVDNCHLKRGKGRPFEINVIPMWIFTILLYAIPAEWQSMTKYILVFVIYCMICAVFQTFLGCVDVIYFNHAVKDEKTRISVQAFNGAATMIANLAAGIAMPILIARFENQPHGWMILALIISIPSAIIGIIRFLTVPEVDALETAAVTDHITIKDTLRSFLSNKYVLIITLMYFAINVLNVFNASGATYYFTYIVGDLSKQALVNVVSIVAALSLIICVPLANKFGKMKVLKVSFIISIIGCLIRFAAGANIPVLMFSTLLSTMVTYPFMSFGGLMLIDSMDFGEWKEGKRVEGAIFAGSNLGSTVGAGVGSSLCGLVLAVSGFNGTLNIQSASALLGIKVAYAIVPAILLVIVMIALHFYDLDERMPEIKRELEERKESRM